MSWLEELEYDYEFVCKEGHVTLQKHLAKNQDLIPREIDCECETCNLKAEYVGSRPMKMGGTAIVQFEKNGRIGYAVTTGGKTSYVSKTKMNYLKTGKNQSGFSKEYERHTADKMENEFGKYRKELDSKAKVTGGTQADARADGSIDKSKLTTYTGES